MSLRAAKKLREKETNLPDPTLTEQPNSKGPEDEPEEKPKKAQKIKNAFEMFGGSEDDDKADSDEEKEQQGNQKEGSGQSNSKKNDNKKKKKKNKNKKKEPEEPNEEEIQKKKAEEERKLDEFLEEYKQGDKPEDSTENCLEISYKNLDYNKELGKYFKGTKLTEKESGEGGRNAKYNKLLNHMKKNRNVKNFKKYKLIYCDTSYMMNPERFKCAQVGQNEYKCRLFAFEPTKRYLELQEAYDNVKNTYDPQMVMQFLRDNSYHTEALFDVAELMRTQGDYKQTNQLLEQIIFIYEDSFGFDFNIFDDDDVALSYDENQFTKIFFVALNRFVNVLGKKGCYKSALEFNKFLVRLNPYQDPVGALLTLDYNAISSKNFDFLEKFPHLFGKKYYKSDQYSLICMPNYLYSIPLCKILKLIENEDIGISQYAGVAKEDFDKACDPSIDPLEQNYFVGLLQAILLYPRVIREIINVNEFSKITMSLGGDKFTGWQKKSYKDILAHDFINSKHEYLYPCLNLNNNSDIEGLNKLLEIYVERSKLIWKNNKLCLVVKACIGLIINQIEAGFNYEEFLEKMFTATFKYKIPFEMSRYRGMLKSNFSDHVERIDFANIPDVQGRPQNGPQPGLNPMNPNSGLLNLIFGSLLPWNHLPPGGNNQGGEESDGLPSDVEIEDEEL